ncbi:MAG: class I SAM-dependent methyltransferase [Pseudorhodobacter sp.]
MTGPIRNLGRRIFNRLLLRNLVYETRNDVALLRDEVARLGRHVRNTDLRVQRLPGQITNLTSQQSEALADQALEHRIALQRALEGRDPGGQATAGLIGLMGRLLELPAPRPEVLSALHAEIRARRPETVVEWGLGLSSLLIVEALGNNGEGCLLGFDDRPGRVAALRRGLEQAGLQDQARLCEDCADPGAIPGQIDLLVLDRTPEAALWSALLSRLAPGGGILLHGPALKEVALDETPLHPGLRGRDFVILTNPV